MNASSWPTPPARLDLSRICPPQVREITAMADGGEWVEEYVSEDGEKLYQSLCSGCHMADGSGAVGARKYPALIGNPNLEFAG